MRLLPTRVAALVQLAHPVLALKSHSLGRSPREHPYGRLAVGGGFGVGNPRGGVR